MNAPVRRAQGGYTYLALMFFIALMGLLMAAAGTAWKFAAQRDKEAELLYVGGEIRTAIEHYVLRGQGGVRGFPRQLEDLVKDDRGMEPQYWLRRLYPDPMTGRPDWTLIKAPDGGIMGVVSTSRGSPLKRDGFDFRNRRFKDAECYCDWKFVYDPRRRRRGAVRFR